MRFGGGILKPYASPDEWLARVNELGYGAAVMPVDSSAGRDAVKAYTECAERNNIVIGEVGVWKNTVSPDGAERKAAVEYAKAQLALADEVGARCCVNIAGARGEKWDGFYAENYADETYALLVDTVREIIDAVKPSRTFYTLEPMPWIYPDSPEDYLRVIKDIDRKEFAVHLDYVNMINGVEKYRSASGFIRHCFKLLGPYVKSVHAKDALIGDSMPCNISEVPPGKGIVDFKLVLKLTQGLGDDMPLFVEHLATHEEYAEAADFIRAQASEAGVLLKR